MFKNLVGVLAVVSTAFLFSCTYKKPAQETPAPNIHRASKDFFGQATAEGWQPKRFICGWAAEDTAGQWAHSIFDHYNYVDHCNIEFTVEQNDLVGRMVQSSFPDDRNRWPVVITIPIRRQYYVEPRKDDKGRDTNSIIENSDRSDPSARPYMDLDFTRVNVTNWAYDVMGGAPAQITSVEDIEWDNQNNFLAFSVTTNFAGVAQANVRFNFLAFNTDKEFTKKKRTLYEQQNSKFFNVLQIIGRKLDGVNQQLYAAHWDLDKPRTIQLVGFPPEYEFIGHDVVKLWNDTFDKVSGKRRFSSVVSNRKHSFDLRYPSIVWVKDKRMSSSGPLGVAMATADVTNGEILWGGITIWGGALESYIRAYLPPQSGSLGAYQALWGKEARPDLQFSLALPQSSFSNLNNPLPLLPSSVGFPQIMSQLQSFVQKNGGQKDEQKQPEFVQNLAQDFMSRTEMFQRSVRLADSMGKPNENMQSLLGQPTLRESMARLPGGTPKEVTQGVAQNLSEEDLKSLIRTRMTRQSSFLDIDRSIDSSMLGWRSGLSLSGKTVEAALPGVVKDILLHEFGHMIGLGHNFEENILPEPGSVPPKYLAKLKADSDNNYLNYTTVMGYKNGITDVLMDYDNIVPGPMDELVLQYIYNQKVATYTEGDDDFKFVPMRNDGKIFAQTQSGGKSLRTAYFPQCNDFEASLGMNPYCNRWDRGSDAVSLVQNYFDDFKASIVAQLHSYSDSIRRYPPWYMEYLVWERSFSTFGRARMFYDYMRQRYASQLKQEVLVSGSRGEQNLLDFSQACEAADRATARSPMVEFFNRAENAKLKDLCRATNVFLKELNQMVRLPGSDYTEFDRSNRQVVSAVTGGDVSLDYSQAWGTWREMARLPIKIAALYSLTTTYPLQFWYGWLFPLGNYTGRDGNFHVSTFYPREYTQLVASTVENNISIGNSDTDTPTRAGRAALALGYLLFYSYYSNDVFLVDKPYIDNIRKQTQFTYNYGIVEITKKEEEGKEIARKFTGQLFTFFSNSRAETLPELYLYTRDRVVAVPPARSLIYPLTSVRWYSANTGYYYVLRVDYADDFFDSLKTRSVKNALEDTYKSVLKNCVEGPLRIGDVASRNGLRYFFNDSVSKELFPGFTFRKTIHQSEVDQRELYKTIEDQYDRYYANKFENGFKFDPAPDPKACTEALRGQGLLVLTATALNGMFLPEILDYTEKGY